MNKILLGVLMVLMIAGGCKETGLQPIASFSESGYDIKVFYDELQDSTIIEILAGEKKIGPNGYKGKYQEHFIANLNEDKRKELQDNGTTRRSYVAAAAGRRT